VWPRLIDAIAAHSARADGPSKREPTPHAPPAQSASLPSS
jgi:hypothetical protein